MRHRHDGGCGARGLPIADAAAQAAIQYGKGGCEGLEEKIQKAIVDAKDKAKDVAGEVKDKAKSAAGAAKDFVVNNKDSYKETARDIANSGKEIALDIAKTGKEVAKAGIAGAKVGWEEAKKVYNENKNN